MCDGIVCRFAFDAGSADTGEYIPDTDRLNRLLEEWYREGVAFCGMVHTHIGGCRALSREDTESIRAIYRAMQKECLYFPIATFDGEEMALSVYRIDGNGIREETLDIV